MPSSKVHAITGVVTSVGVYGIWKTEKEERFSFVELFIATLLGITFACLPDILEPASNPNHRQFFHSILVLAILIGLLFIIFKKSGKENEFPDVLLKIITASYASHLVLDFRTQKCLPIT